MRCFIRALLAAVFTAPLFVLPASAAPAAYFGGLHYRLIGPFRGGRAIAVAGVPGQPEHFYFGAVDGGVWETTNAGRTWTPVFDAQDIGSIGAIAVAPSDPHVIYVGSGEADMRSDIGYGDGMYKSVDGGRTWTHIGLEDSRQIGNIVVDPHDANIVYVSALGHQYGPNLERGVFKSTDGGAHWTKVLFLNRDTGAIDVAMNPRDSQTLLAAMWQTRRPPWNVYPPSNGPSSGLYITHDGGAHWSHVTNGLPQYVGRIGLSYSPVDANRAYAVVDSDVAQGGIYRSDDGGATWHRTYGNTRIWQRGWYFGGITADTQDANTVYVMDTSTYRSTDGGTTFTAFKGDPTGDDFHVMWIDPSDDHRMILGSDQGVAVSVDDGVTWSSWYNQPTAQIYHLSTDNRFPYWVYGSQQDSGSVALPSTGRYSSITMMDFHPIDTGSEDGFIFADPLHPGMIYGTASGFGGGAITYENVSTGWEQTVSPTMAYPAHTWRGVWSMVMAISPVDHALYYGTQNLFRSRNGGKSWQIVSPDLSRAETPQLANLDAPARADDNGLTRHGVIYAIAPSPLDARTIWAGTDDGYVWITHDGGAHWQNVTPPGVSAWSKIGIIDASRLDPNTAYVAVDRHRLDDYAPYIYRTHDGGRTWQEISQGIPYGDFVNVVRADPQTRGLLYAGTEKCVFVSFDDGDHWQSLQLDMPVSSIRDLDVHENDLVVATHGRSVYILDDITRLRQMTQAQSAPGGAYLFALPAAYRVRAIDYDEGTPLPPDEPTAEDAPIGVLIDYVVRDLGDVAIQILDEHGRALRSWSSAHPSAPPNPELFDFPVSWLPVPPVPASSVGGHRFVWDFHAGNDNGPLAPPGRYVVRLTHDGHTYTRAVSVLKDPRVAASVADLQAQYDLAQAIEAREAQIAAARRKTKNPRILGFVAGANPSVSVPVPTHDFTSLRALGDEFDALEQAVESADAAPTPDMRRAYDELSATLEGTLRQIR